MKHGMILIAMTTFLLVATTGSAIAQWMDTGPAIWTSDKVGIGISTPESELHVIGGMRLASPVDTDIKLLVGYNGNGFFFISPFDFGSGTWVDLSLNAGGTTTMGDVFMQGNLGIGTANPQSELAVDGTITAREVVVTTTGWPDFVFEESYSLMPLNELETAIEALGHLPEIPSAEQVAEGGVAVGEMQAKLLQKVEELTLYMIDLEKSNQELRERVSQLESTTPDNVR